MGKRGLGCGLSLEVNNYQGMSVLNQLELKIPPPVYAILIGVLMWLSNQYFPIADWVSSPWNKLGLVLIVGAILMDVSSIFLFFKKHTTPNPMKPQNTSGLVTSGLYRFSRNPMYVGLLVILTGYAVYLGSVMPFIWLPVFYWLITTQQIMPEEKILEKKFGQEYLDYKNSVKRWL